MVKLVNWCIFIFPSSFGGRPTSICGVTNTFVFTILLYICYLQAKSRKIALYHPNSNINTTSLFSFFYISFKLLIIGFSGGEGAAELQPEMFPFMSLPPFCECSATVNTAFNMSTRCETYFIRNTNMKIWM